MRACLLGLGLLLALPSAALADDGDEARRAWGAFFAQTGFGVGGLAGAGFLALEGGDATPAFVLLTGTFTGGGAALGEVAREEGWSPALGWALSGLYPGGALGLAAGGWAGLDPGVDRDLALGLGVGVGAALGAIGLLLDHLLGGSPGGTLLGVWSGFTVGGLAGLGFMLTGEHPSSLVAVCSGALVGALLGGLLGELLR
ncbi:MAG: hypothetical protein VYE22_25035 [Myxococcota bacterium]|nr:hypothetical protein [Myxococcota bacterium]